MELKRAKVVMLPTEGTEVEKSESVIWKEHWEDGILLYGNEIPKQGRCKAYCDCIPQHLYFTTDDEIKEGDWYIYGDKNHRIIQSDGNALKITNKLGKKIVATTDPKLMIKVDEFNLNSIHDDTHPKKVPFKLPLPQPSQAFIEKYCKVCGIGEVMIEYEKGEWVSNSFNPGTEWVTKEDSPCKIKVDSHNTITIHPIKDNWSRDEVLRLVSKAANFGRKWNPEDLESWNNWIKQNL